jgi:hypothetical protein
MLSDVEKVVTCGKMVGFVAPSEKKPMAALYGGTSTDEAQRYSN